MYRVNGRNDNRDFVLVVFLHEPERVVELPYQLPVIEREDGAFGRAVISRALNDDKRIDFETISDDRIIVWADRGELVLAETAKRSPKEFTALTRKRGLMENDVWPHIVLSGGRLYCRDRNGNLKCFDVSQPPAAVE